MMTKSFHQQATGVLGIIAVILTFLLPIKFGMIVGTPEVAYAMPGSPITILIFNWPPLLFTILSALLLCAVAIFGIPPEKKCKLSSETMIAISWVILFLAAIPGIIRASTVDFILIQLIHFAGIAAFAMALMRLIQIRPEIKEWLLNAVIASTLLTAFMGLSQYLTGFEATKNYVYQNELEHGVKVAPGLQNRLEQTRIFSTFSISNSLAAHLILTIPICIWGILSKLSSLKTVVGVFGAYTILMVISAQLHPVVFFLIIFMLLSVCILLITRTNEKNKKYIMPWVLVPSVALLLFILRYTTSSGGLLAFAISMVFFAFLMPISIKLKTVMALVLALIAAPSVFTNLFQKGLSSMNVRFDYYLSALKMFAKHPLTGTGWGDFFHDYTMIKQFPLAEAPHNPHSFILSFTSQAGIPGLIGALFVLSLPFYLFFRSKPMQNVKWLNIVIMTGWFAWGVHSFVDFNIQICGTVATAIALLMIMDLNEEKTKGEAAIRKNIPRTFNGRYWWYACSIPLALITLLVSIQRLQAEKEYANLSEMCQIKYVKPDTPPPPFEKIEQQLKKTDKLMSYSPFPWMAAGTAAQHRREWARSELYFRKAIERSPERASFYYRLAISQGYLGKTQASLKNLKKAAEMYPIAYKEKWDEVKDKY